MGEQSPVLVLVTLQRACARLIRIGADLALKQGRSLHVLHVTTSRGKAQPSIDAQTLDYLYALAGEAGAQMCVMSAEVPITAIANYAQQNAVSQVVMGGGVQASGIAETLSGLLPGVQVLILDPEHV